MTNGREGMMQVKIEFTRTTTRWGRDGEPKGFIDRWEIGNDRKGIHGMDETFEGALEAFLLSVEDVGEVQ